MEISLNHPARRSKRNRAAAAFQTTFHVSTQPASAILSRLMPLLAMSVSNYRSIRRLYCPLGRANVIVGPNGCGKTNLYRALYLIHQAAQGQLGKALGDEGGMDSVLWAGGRKTGPMRLEIEFRSDQVSYHLECGLPAPAQTQFGLDPEIKEERIYWCTGSKKVQMLGRKNTSVWARDQDGRRVEYPVQILSSESVLAEIREPDQFPALSSLRQEILRWRFYHHFRTDAESPIRQPQIGVRTPILSHDGRDLAAAIQTIFEIGHQDDFLRYFNAAFPGAVLEIVGAPRFSVALHMPGIYRPLDTAELSDGTLQYLCLLAALLSPRPPALLALNEPETSIHPDLLPTLAQLIVAAAANSQFWITTHSTALAEAISRETNEAPIVLEKEEGETRVRGQTLLERSRTV